MKKIILIAGTRPEVIKLAPIYRAMRESALLAPVFLSTGQHREMLMQACDAFGIRPDHDLGLMTHGQSLPALTARVVEAVSSFLRKEAPDAVLCQGDTTTVLASALGAFYEGIPVGHVEAGGRRGAEHGGGELTEVPADVVADTGLQCRRLRHA